MNATREPPRIAGRGAIDPARPIIVHRHIGFRLETFDRLKDWQRHLESMTGRRHTNADVLDYLILRVAAP